MRDQLTEGGRATVYESDVHSVYRIYASFGVTKSCQTVPIGVNTVEHQFCKIFLVPPVTLMGVGNEGITGLPLEAALDDLAIGLDAGAAEFWLMAQG